MRLLVGGAHQCADLVEIGFGIALFGQGVERLPDGRVVVGQGGSIGSGAEETGRELDRAVRALTETAAR